IVWIGSPSTVQYLKLIYQPLLELRKCCAFTLRIIGARIEMPGLDTEYIHWNETTEVSSIQTCQVGVMPLWDSPWERGKCGYKLIQYMACALPVVASPVGVNREIVQENVNGFLADDERQWVATLETLLGDKELSQRMGFAGRKRVEEEYCIQKTAPRLIQYLKSVKEYR
ncbi:MAG TPA: glycosyltransferase family 4 protein, partial [Smithellaceae bacterium]|nr:glycosyltransferase family 4 protein [Smithellaceae bacterium]